MNILNIYERMEKENTAEHMKEFIERQKMSYKEKKYYAVGRIRDFLRECSKRGYKAHVSVGGLDSIVLYFFINYAPEMKPKCCTDEKGEKFGWGKVLDYIGVEWETEYGVQEKLF